MIAMEKVIEARLNSSMVFRFLSDDNKKIAIQKALKEISKSNVEYKIDGTYYSETSNKKSIGKWKLNKEANLLYVNVEKKELVYKIITISKNELKLENDKGAIISFKQNQ